MGTAVTAPGLAFHKRVFLSSESMRIATSDEFVVDMLSDKEVANSLVHAVVCTLSLTVFLTLTLAESLKGHHVRPLCTSLLQLS